MFPIIHYLALFTAIGVSTVFCPVLSSAIAIDTGGEPSSSAPFKSQTNSELETSNDVVRKPTGDRPKSSIALIAADPELESWMQSIPPDIREAVSATIESILQDGKLSGKIIGVGQVELPKGTRTYEGRVPKGGILMQQEKVVDVWFGRRSGFLFGTRHRYSSSNGTLHWPWFVTTLEPGKTAELRSFTLQHAPQKTEIPDSKGRHSVVLPPIKFSEAKSNDLLTVTASVTDGKQAIPASACIGLPGFTDLETYLVHDDSSGKIEFSIPGDVFDAKGELGIYFINAFYTGAFRKITKDKFSNGKCKLENIVLKPRQSNIVNAAFTNTAKFADGKEFRLHFDATNPSRGSRRAFEVVQPGESFGVTNYNNSIRVSYRPMTHYVDLGKDFPKTDEIFS